MYYIGVDVGGTNLVAGVVNENNEILATAKVRASTLKTTDELIQGIVRISREAAANAGLEETEIVSVGVGIPGAVNRKRSFVYQCVNMPLYMVAFGDEFRKYWDIPCYLENDANCAVMGEFFAGSAQHVQSAMMVTLGTGVGGGFINRSHLEGGINLNGMEIGHMVIQVDGEPCPCGRKGCWEQYSSATGLKRDTRRAAEAHPDSLMAKIIEKDGKIGGRTAFQAAREGCPVGTEVTSNYLKYLSTGLTNLVNIFQPEIIVLGGGVANEKDEDFLHPLQRMVGGFRFTEDGLVQTKIVKAALGSDAGIVGASLLGRVNLID